MTLAPTPHARLLRRGRMLQWITLAWNIAGVVVLAILALTASWVALRLIGVAFMALAVYLLVASTIALVTQHHAGQSSAGIVWTAVTAAVMFALAAGKARTGRALGNPVLVTEGKVTFIDGLLAVAVLVGLALNLAFGWWWADPVAALIIVFYAIREVIHIARGSASDLGGRLR